MRTQPARLTRLVRQILAQDGDSCAVRSSGFALTYRELACRVSGMARSIAEVAGAERAAVAIVGRPGPAIYVALLGAILADKVPALMDATHPAEKIRRQLDRVGPAVVVGCSADNAANRTVDLAPAGVARLDVNGDGVISGAHATSAQACRRFDARVGYLGFTSGSSGSPKVIMGNGDGLAHFIDWQRTTFDIRPSDRFGQVTSPSFDVFYRDVLTPLASGATLLPAADEQARGGGMLDWLAQMRITHLHAVPSLARYWLHEQRSGPAPTLVTTFFAGEPLPGKLVADWRAATGSAQRVLNLYGAAEATLAQTWYDVVSDGDPGTQPVGVPLPDIDAMVLDGNGRPCPPGVVGEVVIESEFVSFGYLPAADDDRYCPSPLARDGAQPRRRHHTGDRGCWRDGRLHLTGRLDREVKIRGVRGNLDEIAAILAEHPFVEQALVACAEDAFGGTVLRAYVVGRGDDHPAVRELRAHVGRLLPDPLVPTRYDFLSDLPRGHTGKALQPAEQDRDRDSN